jgi:hypothetical protein
MTLFLQLFLKLFNCSELGRVHEGQGIDVLCLSQLRVKLENQVPLLLELALVRLFKLGELNALAKGFLGRLDFVGSHPDGLVFQEDTLLELLDGI